jgi:uncharacterized membrane protein
VLGLASVQLLVIFIYRVGRSIDVGDIATRVGKDAEQEVGQVYPDRFTKPATTDGGDIVATWRQGTGPQVVHAGQSGYVEEIRHEALIQLLGAGRTRAHLLVCTGDVVTLDTVIAEVWASEPLSAETLDRAAATVAITSQRTMQQDPEFGLRQLTDIALRAISPGVNDPTTAVMCIGYLRNLLEQLAARADLPAVVETGSVTIVV